jgi:hypothetical protein
VIVCVCARAEGGGKKTYGCHKVMIHSKVLTACLDHLALVVNPLNNPVAPFSPIR